MIQGERHTPVLKALALKPMTSGELSVRTGIPLYDMFNTLSTMVKFRKLVVIGKVDRRYVYALYGTPQLAEAKPSNKTPPTYRQQLAREGLNKRV